LGEKYCELNFDREIKLYENKSLGSTSVSCECFKNLVDQVFRGEKIIKVQSDRYLINNKNNFVSILNTCKGSLTIFPIGDPHQKEKFLPSKKLKF